jgi:hypothetical protein
MKSDQVTVGTQLVVLSPREAAQAITFTSTATAVVGSTGSPVTSVTDDWVGRLISGTNWTNGTTIVSVIPGVSFTASAAPAAAVTAATIIDNKLFAGSFPKPRSVLIKNTSTDSVYIGGSNVSSSNGFVLAQNNSITVDLTADQVYAVTGTGTALVHLLWTT